MLLAFASGIHPRIGNKSPIQAIGPYVVQRIAELVCLEIHLKHMLDDYFAHHQPHCVVQFIEANQGMRERFLANTPLPRSCSLRLEAYQSDQQDRFLKQPVQMIICEECGATYYHDGPLEGKINCRHCQSQTLVMHMILAQIPPWIDLDTYSSYTGTRHDF